MSVCVLERQHRLHSFEDMGNVFCSSAGNASQHGAVSPAQPANLFFRRPFGQLSQSVTTTLPTRSAWRATINAHRPVAVRFGYNLNPPYFPSYTNINDQHTPGQPGQPPVVQQVGQFGYQRAPLF